MTTSGQASLLRFSHQARAHIANAAAQTRIVSVARNPLDSGNLTDLSKGYFTTTFLSSSPTTSATQSGLCSPRTAGEKIRHGGAMVLLVSAAGSSLDRHGTR